MHLALALEIGTAFSSPRAETKHMAQRERIGPWIGPWLWGFTPLRKSQRAWRVLNSVKPKTLSDRGLRNSGSTSVLCTQLAECQPAADLACVLTTDRYCSWSPCGQYVNCGDDTSFYWTFAYSLRHMSLAVYLQQTPTVHVNLRPVSRRPCFRNRKRQL